MLLALAVKFGGTRLIDNARVGWAAWNEDASFFALQLESDTQGGDNVEIQPGPRQVRGGNAHQYEAIMAAKKGSAEDTALEAMRKLVADPRPRVLFGKSGIFSSKKNHQDAASLCQTNSWLESTQEMIKKEHLYRITINGIHAVLSKTDSAEVLKSLQASLGEIEASLRDIPDKVVALQSAVTSIAAKSQPPDIATLARQLAASSSSDVNRLESAIRDILAARKASGEGGDCSLSDLYKNLQERVSPLTIGAFHDALRKLKKEGKLRLTHWALPLMEIPESDLAFVTSHKVMYYVDLA